MDLCAGFEGIPLWYLLNISLSGRMKYDHTVVFRLPENIMLPSVNNAGTEA